MNELNRRLIRIAMAIHERLKTRPPDNQYVELPTSAWQQTETLFRRLRRAQVRGWTLASRRLERDFTVILSRLVDQLTATNRVFRTDNTPTNNTPVNDIYSDLVALEQEFPGTHFDQSSRTISVTTEPITLQGIYLGPFDIRLDWSDFGGSHCPNYRVIAVDPNPAASDESITHPHVQDETVCEGEGRQAIRNAVGQGRVLDFFLLVANLLRTYGSNSPYVSLSSWHGTPCGDCGASVSVDERENCDSCEIHLCDQCFVGCTRCGRTFCSECIAECEHCNDPTCNRCLTQCGQCEANVCQGCLGDEKLPHQERCLSCHEQESEEKDLAACNE